MIQNHPKGKNVRAGDNVRSKGGARTAQAGADHPIARLRGVRVHYHATGAWAPATPVDLDLLEGSQTVLIGPSGCGKSTLTLTLNGLVPHSIPSDYSGSILVAGTEVADADIAPLAQRVGLVMQDPDSQIVTRSVWDEVCYALENLCIDRKEIDERAADALQLLGIDDLAARDPWTLSGGQRQRVVLAGALAVRPSLLILDEPTANLDPMAARDFHEALTRITDEAMTLLVIEHNLDYLAHRIDRVVALDATGSIIADGSPRQVFSEYADALVEAGIRIPASVRLGQRLGSAPPPLTPDETTALLARLAPSLPAPTAGDASLIGGPPSRADSLPAALEADKLCVERAKRPVLRGVDLSLFSGEMVALLGVNGAGKSTLLRTLVGLEAPRSGTIRVNGRAATGWLMRRRIRSACTLVTQNPEHQFVTASVRDELAHSMRLARYPAPDVSATVERLLVDYGLEAFADHNPFTLSGGQKRRLSVAAALTIPRDAVLLDEPTFGQDESSVIALMEHIRAFADRGGAVLFATHDLDVAAAHADRVVVLDAGSVIADGPARAVLSDDALLERAGLVPTPLAIIAARAREADARIPQWISWADVPVMSGVHQ